MKLNVAFTNDLANNISKLTSFNSNYAGQQKMLQNLHIEIDNELGINHQEDGQWFRVACLDGEHLKTLYALFRALDRPEIITV